MDNMHKPSSSYKGGGRKAFHANENYLENCSVHCKESLHILKDHLSEHIVKDH